MLRGPVALVELDRLAYTFSSASMNVWLLRVSLTVEVLSVLVIMYTITSTGVSSCAIVVVVELNPALVVEVNDTVVVVEGGEVVEVNDTVVVVEGGEVVVVESVSVPFPVKFPGMSVVAGVLVVPRGMFVVPRGMFVVPRGMFVVPRGIPVVGMGMVVNWD